MSVTTIIRITHPETTAQLSEYLGRGATEPVQAATGLAKYLQAIANGSVNASITIGEDDSAAASGTATFAGVVATDVLTVNGVAFGCVASGATGNQFNKGASDAASAAACAAKINAATDATVAGIVTASAAGGVITITAAHTGISGNAFTLAQTGNHITLSAATLENGAEATTPTSYTFG